MHASSVSHLAPNGAVLAVLAEGEYEIIKPCASDPQTWTSSQKRGRMGERLRHQ